MPGEVVLLAMHSKMCSFRISEFQSAKTALVRFGDAFVRIICCTDLCFRINDLFLWEEKRLDICLREKTQVGISCCFLGAQSTLSGKALTVL